MRSPRRAPGKGLLDTLRASLNDAKRYGFIRDNPCTGVELPRAESTQAQIWTPAQVQAFLASTRRSRYVTLWRLLFATGLRRGEALGLRWGDVDLESRRISVRRNLQADSREGNIRYGPTKSRRSTRTITIDPGTAEELLRWQKMRRTEHGAYVADLERRLATYRTPGARLPELPAVLSEDSPLLCERRRLPDAALDGVGHLPSPGGQVGAAADAAARCSPHPHHPPAALRGADPKRVRARRSRVVVHDPDDVRPRDRWG